jgi:hypothetical protein
MCWAISEFFNVSYAYCNFSKLVIKKCRKLHSFKWQLPFLTIDINVKFNFKATFINILYADSQPFWRNFYFLNKILFFFIKQLSYLNFYSKIACNRQWITTKYIIKNKQINKKIFSMKTVHTFTLKYFFVNLLVFYYYVAFYYLLQCYF